MCGIEGCDRHEFNNGLCLDHLKEEFGLITLEKPKRRSRKKKVDAEEVTTNDETSELETRDESDRQV